MKKDGLLVLPGGTLQVGGGPPGDEGPRGKGWDRVYYDPITDDIVFESDEYPDLNYRTPALAGPRQAAQDWADAAEQSASQAASSAIAVESYKDDAELAAQQAAQDAQATAADRVVTGQDRQQTGLDRQQTGSDADATAADRVATGQDVQATAADRVATGQDRQQTGLDRAAAESAKDDAEDARDLAKDWANKPEDQVVDAGEYSAKHYAAKAGKSAADAEDTKEGLLDDLTVDATTLAPGAPATASWDGNAQKITFGIPEGQPGDVGNAVRWDVAQSLSGSEQQQARDNIGLGSAAVKSEGDFATSAQGGKADTAVQPGDLAVVATSGAYNDLTGKPTLGELAAKDKAHIVNDTTATLPVNRGGTGATAAAAARDNLGLTYASTAEAGAGTAANRVMSPIRTAHAIEQKAVLKEGDTGIGGYSATSKNLGNLSGTVTLAPSVGNIQHANNNGAATIAAPTAGGVYTIIVEITNSASAGALTLTGFDDVDGDDLTTDNGHKFLLYVTKTNSSKTAIVKALQ